MANKSVALLATVVAFTLLGAPIAATAETSGDQTQPSAVSFHSEDNGGNQSESENHDGDRDKDDDHGYIPPVFVVPGAKKHNKLHQTRPTTTTNTSGMTNTKGNSGNLAGTAGIDPVTSATVTTENPEDLVVDGVNPNEVSTLQGAKDQNQPHPVDIKRVELGMRSPADQFLDTAYIGLGLLGLSAIGLGGAAVVRGVRLRRSGKADYLYGDK